MEDNVIEMPEQPLDKFDQIQQQINDIYARIIK